MKNNYVRNVAIMLLYLLIANNANTQPSLSGSNANPQVGETFTSHSFDATGVLPGNPGSNVSWDFSSLSSTGTSTLTWVAPSSTPYASSFLNATVAAGSSGAYEYCYTSSSEYTREGIVGSGVVIPYTDTEKMLQYPCNYNSSFIDDFAATFTSGITLDRHGNIEVTADGYGSIVLPYGTVDDVLRIQLKETYQDDYNGTPMSFYSTELYLWYKPGIHHPVMSLTAMVINGTASYYGSYIDQSYIGIDDLTALDHVFDFYPNPSDGIINIKSNSDIKDIELTITDTRGRIIYRKSNDDKFMNAGQIDLSDFPEGIYFVRLQNKDHTMVRKLIIN